MYCGVVFVTDMVKKVEIKSTNWEKRPFIIPFRNASTSLEDFNEIFSA